MMPSREEIDAALRASEGLYTDAVIKLMEEQQAKYAELVKFVGIQIEKQGINTVHGLVAAYQPFIKTKASEELFTLADRNAAGTTWHIIRADIRKIAATVQGYEERLAAFEAISDLEGEG